MLKLNLGSFKDVIPGWVNVDILPLGQHLPPNITFVQHDLRQPMPFENADLIRASHIIEHLTLEEGHFFLKDCYRVLKPGGLIRLATPDLTRIVTCYNGHEFDMAYFNDIQPKKYIDAPTEGEKFSRLLFSCDYAHRAVYDWPMMRDFLEKAGFLHIKRRKPGDSWNIDMQTQATDQHVKVSLYVEAIK